jgi:hypothetical protein
MYIKVLIFDRKPTSGYKKPDEVIKETNRNSTKCIEHICCKLKERR